ncbi:MAG: beta-N-acetylhexosaminidase [Prevotella sp.]|nr:beta-N-acetylhexosaminidase [Prevotella sp.]
MKRHVFFLLVFALPLLSSAQELADFNVVPKPRQCVEQKGGPFALSSLAAIVYEGGDEMRRNASFLAEYIGEVVGKEPPVRSSKVRGSAITLRLNKKMTGEEAYRISVNQKGVVIEGATPQGVFRGVQTFRKALPVHAAGEVLVPAVVVDDEPRFAYRGMHLDVSRHFFDMDFVRQYIDMLALHHINVFHFHLTDDQGWRVEIKKYPKLTEVGAWRNRTVVGRNTGLYYWQRHGGYFTQDQIRDIVDYAARRYITVVPEIDMPGHMVAALAAYPELGCTGGPYEVEPNWGVFDDILCAGKEKTFEFVEGVLEELVGLFPAEYFHIGGDEAPRTRWKECALCQQCIQQEGLKGDGEHSAEDRLQGYFMKRVERFLNSKGKKVIGWDELLDCDVNPSTTIMSWRGVEGGMTASAKGHDVIMVPTSWFYFDYYQTNEEDWVKPFLIGGYVPLEKVYSFEPAPDTLTPEQRAHIIGLQANLWTEYIYAKELAEYQVLPRMGALSELQWMLPEQKNYEEYKARQKRLNTIYEAKGWKYCKEEFKKE